MRKKFLPLIVIIFFIFFCHSSFAGTQMHTWAIGTEISHINYKEPGLMEQKGYMYGINAFYAYHNNFMLKTDIRYIQGEVDYKSNGTGKMNNIDDYIFEVRGLAGYDFKLSSKEFITPYIGFGYRYLNDDMSGKQTSTGHWGYERESFYYYIPIGFEAVSRLDTRWSVTVKLEYDYFWDGKQKSRLSDVYSGYNNIKNDQDGGYGIRGSIKILYDYSYVKISFEPFINYWSIDESDSDLKLSNGVSTGYYGYEPDNRSTEIGMRVIFEY